MGRRHRCLLEKNQVTDFNPAQKSTEAGFLLTRQANRRQMALARQSQIAHPNASRAISTVSHSDGRFDAAAASQLSPICLSG